MSKAKPITGETVGFNKDRGDSVNLMNTPFTIEKQTVTDLPLWKQPELQDLARSFAWPLGTLLLAALVLLGVVRPAFSALSRAPTTGLGQGAQVDTLVSDEPERPPLLSLAENQGAAALSKAHLRLEDARKLTRDNPAAVANIVKAWIGSESPA